MAVGVDYIVRWSVSIVAAAQAEQLLAACLKLCAIIGLACFAEGLAVLGDVIDIGLALYGNEFPTVVAHAYVNIAIPTQEVIRA